MDNTSWYRVSKDVELKNRKTVKIYRTVFETSDYALSEESVDWCRGAMDRKTEDISNVEYIYDSLLALRNIQACGSCNDCGLARICKVRPLPGQMVRYNCPFWAKADDQQETVRKTMEGGFGDEGE